VTLLVTLDQVKAHLRVDNDDEDDDLTLKIHAASAAVLSYLKDTAYLYVDTSGETIADIPYQVQAATLLLMGAFYGNRGEDGGQSSGFGNYLPPAVVALLYPLRVPTVV
jgi:hypothetical protein